MTEQEYLALSQREQNALVAYHVKGWSSVFKPSEWDHIGSGGVGTDPTGERHVIPPFFADMGPADAVAALKAKGAIT